MIRRLGWSLGCVLALGACDGEPVMVDAGYDAGGPPPVFIEAVTGEDAAGDPILGAADYSCRGTRTAPAGSGAAITFNVAAESFGAPGAPAVEGLTVNFYADNIIPLDGSCTAPGCTQVMTGAGGIASVMDVEGSWYAYSIAAGRATAAGIPTDFIDVVQYNEEAPAAAGEATIFAVSESTQDTIIALLGSTRVAGTAVVTGQVFDCAGNAVVNATVRIFDSAGPIELGLPGFDTTFQFYFDGDQFPRAVQRDTNTDGLYGGANLPVPSDRVLRVEIYGNIEGTGEVMLGCEEVQVSADGIGIMNVGPTREDGPTGCSG